MGGKARKPFPPWQSSRKDDGFNMLSNTLTHSEAFRCLSGKQKSLYLLCMQQLKAVMTPRKIYPSVDQVCGDDTFFLTFSTACNDGLYKVKSESTFRRDMAKLQEVGLIRCISNGKNRRIKSVYQMSSEWQAYKLENTLAK